MLFGLLTSYVLPLFKPFSHVHMYLSLCLVCVLIFNLFRLGFYVYVLLKYHNHSFTCSCTMSQAFRCYNVSKVSYAFTCTCMFFVQSSLDMCMKLMPCFLYDLLAATLMFIAVLPCLGCCLALKCMIEHSHVR